jgi:hypothetical protein
MASEKRLIDANDLWSDIMMLPHNGDMISSEEVEQAIMDAPTVDAVEVVHGYNLDEDTPSLFECSICHWSCSDTYYGDTADYNYCPNCGAKMDGDGDV